MVVVVVNVLVPKLKNVAVKPVKTNVMTALAHLLVKSVQPVAVPLMVVTNKNVLMHSLLDAVIP